MQTATYLLLQRQSLFRFYVCSNHHRIVKRGKDDLYMDNSLDYVLRGGGKSCTLVGSNQHLGVYCTQFEVYLVPAEAQLRFSVLSPLQLTCLVLKVLMAIYISHLNELMA